MLDHLEREVECMKKLDDRNIVKLIDFIDTSNHQYIVLEFCNYKALSDIMRIFRLHLAFIIIFFS